jgi:hypothetical protein
MFAAISHEIGDFRDGSKRPWTKKYTEHMERTLQ